MIEAGVQGDRDLIVFSDANNPPVILRNVSINFINACDDRAIYGVFSAVKRNVLMPDKVEYEMQLVKVGYVWRVNKYHSPELG